jgi:hypothetical protein
MPIAVTKDLKTNQATHKLKRTLRLKQAIAGDLYPNLPISALN